MHHLFILIAALLLIALAAVLRLYVGKRRFQRRNWSGMQVFTSYRHNIICTVFENFLMFIATASTIFAIILFAIYFIH